uniref:Uncharacterized protein n=1 Tax=Cacopsylla melanoneura TaxID=428564 RepID=A0A8D8VT63_9HEMI
MLQHSFFSFSKYVPPMNQCLSQTSLDLNLQKYFSSLNILVQCYLSCHCYANFCLYSHINSSNFLCLGFQFCSGNLQSLFDRLSYVQAYSSFYTCTDRLSYFHICLSFYSCTNFC